MRFRRGAEKKNRELGMRGRRDGRDGGGREGKNSRVRDGEEIKGGREGQVHMGKVELAHGSSVVSLFYPESVQRREKRLDGLGL